MSVVFAMDVFVSFNTGYYDKGLLVFIPYYFLDIR